MSPTSGERVVLVDTSTAVPLVLSNHAEHDRVFAALADRELGLAGHAALETFSVLTRLPAAMRRTPAAVSRLLAANFPHSRFLGAYRAAQLLEALADRGVAGGAVYDALVGAAVVEHDGTLATRDLRALPTYRELGVRLELVG